MMKIILISLLGVLLVGCGDVYYDLTLANQADNHCQARLFIDDTVLVADGGESMTASFEESIYDIEIHIIQVPEPTIIEYQTISLDRDLICVIMQNNVPITWE